MPIPLLAGVLLLFSGLTAGAVVRVYPVAAEATDPAIVRPRAPHRVFLDPAAPARNELLVYLPGTGATTEGQDEFGRTAAAAGYHVVFLMYPNDVPAAVCQQDEDPAGFEKLRREIISGQDLDARVTVDRANSIENRLAQLVRWLAANHAAEGWGHFLADGGIRWSAVVLAGHSQGGGHALLMAKDHRVARVVLLGAPKDFNRRLGAPAAWYGGGATPATRVFALVHRQDTQGCTYDQQLENLRAAGVTTVADADAGSPPYHHAQVLTTDQPGHTVSSGLAHLGLVFDFTLPRVNGRNPYAAAWRHLLTEPPGD